MMFENPQSDVENAPEPELGEKTVYDIPERGEDDEPADAELAEQRLNADDGHYLSHAEVFPHDEEGSDPEPTLEASFLEEQGPETNDGGPGTAVEVPDENSEVKYPDPVPTAEGELSFDDASILASEGGDIARRSWANPHAFLRFVDGELMFCVDHKPQMREYTITPEDDAATDWYVFDIPETAED